MPRIASKKIKDEESFLRQLKGHGMKVTPQRLAVHRAMMELVHASADMVKQRIGDSCRISTVSVYGILSELADKGIYSRRMSATNKMFFDIDPRKHVHLYDSRNNEFLDVNDDTLLPLVESGLKGKRFRGYKMDGIDIQIICHPTRKKVL